MLLVCALCDAVIEEAGEEEGRALGVCAVCAEEHVPSLGDTGAPDFSFVPIGDAGMAPDDITPAQAATAPRPRAGEPGAAGAD